jgi:transcriptional regulator with XRE-family HTH domain
MGGKGDEGMSEFSERLTRLRAERNLTLKVVCVQVGIPPSRLVELERGIRIPTPGQIQRLENYYETGMGVLAALANLTEETEKVR